MRTEQHYCPDSPQGLRMRMVAGLVVILGSLGLISACDGSSGADGGTGSLVVAMTDAPVHSAAEVWVAFSGVTVKPESGPPIDFDFSEPRSMDLLTLTNGETEVLLDAEGLPVGRYEWLSLHVNAEFDGVMDSYVLTDTGDEIELRVPSGAQSGLRLVSGFTITTNQTTSLVIDWDLRQALVNPVGQPGWFLRPALRISDMARYGTISGIVDEGLLLDESCSNDLGRDLGNAVYLYEGHGVTPSDITGGDSDPIVTGNVSLNVDEDRYEYRLHFVSPGDYTIALTCQALDDDPEVDDGLDFVAPTDVTVIDGEVHTVNFD